jgi:methionine biosynthesis protein MetW
MSGSPTSLRDRALDDEISRLVSPGDSLLDLGCGPGDLLLRLKEEKSVLERGIEIDGPAVAEAIARGLSVVEGDLEEGLSFLGDSSYDLVIINHVLPQVRDPLDLVSSALRVGKKVIVTFPNFAYWRVRLQLFLAGRLPVTQDLPYAWYDTPHIRLFTVADFRAQCGERGWRVLEERFVSRNGNGRSRPTRWAPNLRSSLALFLLARR